MSLTRLVKIVRRLRAPGGCPWDRRQTHRSIRQYLLEETYEVLEAIERKDRNALKEELGDLLLQIVLHAAIEEERKKFTIEDIIRHVSDKIVRRHPHVFGRERRTSVSQVLRRWEILKQEETGGRSTLAGVPKKLPALLRAVRIQDKAARLGFEWQRFSQAFAKFEEETQELKEALRKRRRSEVEHELGDALFALAKVAKFLRIDPEAALQTANRRFLKRFGKLEGAVRRKGRRIHEVPPSQLYALWRITR